MSDKKMKFRVVAIWILVALALVCTATTIFGLMVSGRSETRPTATAPEMHTIEYILKNHGESRTVIVELTEPGGEHYEEGPMIFPANNDMVLEFEFAVGENVFIEI